MPSSRQQCLCRLRLPLTYIPEGILMFIINKGNTTYYLYSAIFLAYGGVVWRLKCMFYFCCEQYLPLTNCSIEKYNSIKNNINLVLTYDTHSSKHIYTICICRDNFLFEKWIKTPTKLRYLESLSFRVLPGPGHDVTVCQDCFLEKIN